MLNFLVPILTHAGAAIVGGVATHQYEKMARGESTSVKSLERELRKEYKRENENEDLISILEEKLQAEMRMESERAMQEHATKREIKKAKAAAKAKAEEAKAAAKAKAEDKKAA